MEGFLSDKKGFSYFWSTTATNPPLIDDSTNLRAQAMAALSEVFFERACLIENLGTMES